MCMYVIWQPFSQITNKEPPLKMEDVIIEIPISYTNTDTNTDINIRNVLINFFRFNMNDINTEDDGMDHNFEHIERIDNEPDEHNLMIIILSIMIVKWKMQQTF